MKRLQNIDYSNAVPNLSLSRLESLALKDYEARNQPNIQLNQKLLTKREVDIVNCLLNGRTAKQTARELFISHRTVERHLENIKIKLSCNTKLEIVNRILNCVILG